MRNTPPDRAIIRISNLALRTIIGANDWERKKRQDVVINLTLVFDPRQAIQSDKVADTLDYKKAKRAVINTVEKSRFKLLESLTAKILSAVMRDPGVLAATVRIDKPHALRFADSVSIEMSREREA